MRLKVLSDLHLDFFLSQSHKQINGNPIKQNDLKELIRSITEEKVDVLIVAGDLCQFNHLSPLLPYIKELTTCADTTIFVPGNHEYYKSTFVEVEKMLKENNNLFIVLNDDVIELNGYKFIGSTLWFKDTPQARVCTKELADFIEIQETRDFLFSLGDKCMNFLREAVSKDSIVITHHMPCSLSVADRYKFDSATAFFLHDCERIIVCEEPKLWVHGHTHDHFDYMVGNTRVACNPKGYPSEATCSQFNPNLIIELE
jgi:predicted phosphohydrolase